MRDITRGRSKIDCITSAWLSARFIDMVPTLPRVPACQVRTYARPRRTTAELARLVTVLYACTLIFSVLLSQSAMAAANASLELTGAQIHAAISGRYVTDGQHWGHQYFADGRVKRSENGRERSARWMIHGNRLCLLRSEISQDQPICYRVLRDRQQLQYEDDGGSVVFRGAVRPMPPAERRRTP